MLDEAEFRRWMRQAEHTLASAERDRAEGDYAWACFKAEQAAQYALKAFLIGIGQAAHGHSLRRLIRQVKDLGLRVPSAVMDAAEGLERHYIPSRYPDAYPEGSPFEFYHDKQAREAIRWADRILDFVSETFRRVQRTSTS
ncbi:MAG: HEPN domain-containing protein [Acidobacteria bacterium]|nr:HEPN domain-containing protein [Acidobacteriota bacterium]MDW7984590.1 HEPN domain-containing protein [Acidobacteriota bacterium]